MSGGPSAEDNRRQDSGVIPALPVLPQFVQGGDRKSFRSPEEASLSGTKLPALTDTFEYVVIGFIPNQSGSKMIWDHCLHIHIRDAHLEKTDLLFEKIEEQYLKAKIPVALTLNRAVICEGVLRLFDRLVMVPDYQNLISLFYGLEMVRNPIFMAWKRNHEEQSKVSPRGVVVGETRVRRK